jgi:hypothetical protein
MTRKLVPTWRHGRSLAGTSEDIRNGGIRNDNVMASARMVHRCRARRRSQGDQKS